MGPGTAASKNQGAAFHRLITVKPYRRAYEGPMRKTVLPLVWELTTFPWLDAAAQQGPKTPQMRTYVSGVGKDSNPCTASSPCKTFQAAMALTVAGGEIYVLDSADYGAVTIDKPVSITSEGAMAGVLATSGAG